MLDRHAGVIILACLLALAFLTSGCGSEYVVREGKVLELSRDQVIRVWITQQDGSVIEAKARFFAQDTIVRGHVE